MPIEAARVYRKPAGFRAGPRLGLLALAFIAPRLHAAADLPGVREADATLAVGTVHYRDSGGKGPVVVFLHAGSGNSAVWEKQIAPLVAAGYRFVAYDRVARNAGQGVGQGVGQSVDQSGAELSQLMDSLGVRRFHLVGVAAGGGVALQYALNNGARVLTLTIANSIGNVQDPGYVALGQRLRPPAFNSLPLEFRELGPSYRAVDPDGVQRWLTLSQQGKPAESAPAGASGPPAGGPPPSGPPAGGAPTGGPAAGGGTPVTWAALEKLAIPTLLMTGDADLYTPPSVLRMFKQHMPAAELHIIPESGHASYWENPALFNSTLLGFLKRHR